MNKNDVLFCIMNYKEKQNAEKLYKTISPWFPCHILDAESGEKPDAFGGDTIYLPNVFFGGLLQNAIELAQEGHHRFLFFICSDVVFPEEEFIKQKDILLAEEFSNVGVYCPSHQKDSYTFVKWPYNQATNKKRDVPCVEAMISMWNIRVCEHIHPCIENKYGWGLDICAAYYCLQNGFKQMIDDRVSIYHPMGAVGKNEKASIAAQLYIDSKPNASDINYLWQCIYANKDKVDVWWLRTKYFKLWNKLNKYYKKICKRCSL